MLSARLDLRHTQSLVITPQLQQAIKLLQFSNLELSAYVNQALERNPLLQRDEAGEGALACNLSDEDRLGTERAEGLLDSIGGQKEAPLDIDYDNVFASDEPAQAYDWGGSRLFDWSGQGKRTDFEEPNNTIERAASAGVNLRDHLAAQLGLEVSDSTDRMIGAYLIEMLDDAGYLIGDLREVATQLDCELARVETVLVCMQQFDPPGIFARNLRECLTIQLREYDRLDPVMQILLDNLNLLAKRDFGTLLQRCGVNSEDLAEMVTEIRALRPKPAAAFDAVPVPLVTPDILMRSAPNGGWLVDLNADTLPRLLVDTRYYTKVARTTRSKEEKAYLNENLQAANWLVKSLHQRATTILKVASEIVRQQDAFFVWGVEHLKPLVLRDIAQAISMHESTVSRVTSNKYIATPCGILELKYFFTQAINSPDGRTAYSTEAVRHRIRTLINVETHNRILSDNAIVTILRQDGIAIARRTVAKYRETLHIPASAQRRREKTMLLPGTVLTSLDR